MEDIGKVLQYKFHLFGLNIVFNVETLLMTYIIMAFLMLISLLLYKKVSLIPSKLQVIFEPIIEGFDGLVKDTLETDDRKYYALITALFLFLFLCDSIGIIPGCEEPTKDLNTPLGLGIMGFIIAHYSGIKVKGLKKYLKEYLDPFFVMAPLNVIGELAKIVSISFRLFGNMMGGSIIIAVVSHLVYNLALPPFLYAFFGLFDGTIQAFVFTMLTLVYISLQVKE